MAKPNDMPEFHSVKVSLTENIPASLSRQSSPDYTGNYANNHTNNGTSNYTYSYAPLKHNGGYGHV